MERNELWSQPNLISTLKTAISEELLNTLGLSFLTCEIGLLKEVPTLRGCYEHQL